MDSSIQLLALQYGLRLDASESFIQGYVDGMRLDQRGQGVACGRGWIPRSKKCSSDKAKQTSKEAKAKTVEKARERAELKRAVKAERPSPEAVQAEVENIQKGSLGAEGIANLRKRFFESNTPDGKSARRQALTMAKYSAEKRGTTVDQEMDFIVTQAGIPTKALAKFSVIEKNRERLKQGRKSSKESSSKRKASPAWGFKQVTDLSQGSRDKVAKQAATMLGVKTRDIKEMGGSSSELSVRVRGEREPRIIDISKQSAR